MKSVAIIGTGIAGLGCARQLYQKCELTIFEQNDYIGGHTNTVEIKENDNIFPVDTGFMVFNTATYPNLTKLFLDLEISAQPTDMSFSVQLREQNDTIEWCGSSFDQVFGQRKNLFSPRFWRMIMDLLRFNKIAEVEYSSNTIDDMTIEEYVESKGLGRDLLDLYLIPMASSLWSSTPTDMKNFSAKALLQFFHNHRLNSGLKGHLKWLTIEGGAKEYVKRMIPPFDNCIQLNKEVISVNKLKETVEVKTKDGQSFTFDIVIVATHGDQALSILSNPSESEKNLLSQFKYTANSVLLHSDPSIMPKNKRCWASWNHLIEKDEHGLSHASTHYWMNNLQSLPTKNNYFVSLNADSLINPNSVIKRIHYTHPTFSIESIKTQRALGSINSQEKEQRLFFCGSYFGYGFHEDALSSALNLCQLISV